MFFKLYGSKKEVDSFVMLYINIEVARVGRKTLRN